MVTVRRFEGRAALVTGGLGGIGRAVALRLAREGAMVALLDREASEAAVAELIAAGAPSARSLVADISREDEVTQAFEATLAAFGRIDVAVNVAGVMIYKPIADLTAADWIGNLSVNLVGAALVTTQAFRRMGQGGAIVNVASVHAERTSPLVAPYAASKAAMLSLTRSSAIEGRALGIRANAVLPGAIDTPMLWSSPNIASGAEVIAPEDIGRPEDIADAVAFLASDEARFVSGANLLVEGGRLARL
ncbi:SDR family oxidoreductase [Brevundimonas sp.]|uniref:SDR family NAD(P)-dependent oxidoreductase n=1 Tax=Brevundimonas sp. TaxID=1871086 RepID=UPI002ABC444B|nr:SDR family oxidoreductase [Brevundimonas sp.]MDZ4362847.1 SDR family oxidoreductase [Brevundimonas sp.]